MYKCYKIFYRYSDYVIDGTKQLKIIINEAVEIILKC